jgi:hypothetical protein
VLELGWKYINFENGIYPGPQQCSQAWVYMREFVGHITQVSWTKLVWTVDKLRVVEMSMFIWGGQSNGFNCSLHEKHTTTTWNSEQSLHLLQDIWKPRKPVSRWLVSGPSGYLLTSNQKSVIQSMQRSPELIWKSEKHGSIYNQYLKMQFPPNTE